MATSCILTENQDLSWVCVSTVYSKTSKVFTNMPLDYGVPPAKTQTLGQRVSILM